MVLKHDQTGLEGEWRRGGYSKKPFANRRFMIFAKPIGNPGTGCPVPGVLDSRMGLIPLEDDQANRVKLYLY